MIGNRPNEVEIDVEKKKQNGNHISNYDSQLGKGRTTTTYTRTRTLFKPCVYRNLHSLTKRSRNLAWGWPDVYRRLANTSTRYEATIC